MADLVGGHYPQSQALQALLGLGGQSAQGNLPIRSNLELPVYSGAIVDTASIGGATSGVAVAVPIPVDVGMTVTKVSLLIGATAASTPTHQFAALYSGTAVAAPPLIGQTSDATTTAIAASGRYDFTFTTTQTITAAQAPSGYIWAAVSITGTTIPSALTTPCGAAAGQYRWFAGSPLYFSQTAGSGLGGTAASTLVNASTLTVAPIVLVW